jgi:hypothetical protein
MWKPKHRVVADRSRLLDMVGARRCRKRHILVDTLGLLLNVVAQPGRAPLVSRKSATLPSRTVSRSAMRRRSFKPDAHKCTRGVSESLRPPRSHNIYGSVIETVGRNMSAPRWRGDKRSTAIESLRRLAPNQWRAARTLGLYAGDPSADVQLAPANMEGGKKREIRRAADRGESTAFEAADSRRFA